MSINPKLEFYRFKLNHKDNGYKTFRDFAIESLGLSTKSSKSEVITILFKHFVKSIDGVNSKDDNMKKQIAIVKKKNVNKYIELQPVIKSESDIIHGVINGGYFGRDRILAEKDNLEESSSLGRNKSVLQYYYFLLYLPTDHNEGCFIIHSNSKEENITNIFRNFIGHLFKKNSYNKAICEIFCPKSFQDEFRNGSNLDSIIFKQSIVDASMNTDGVSDKIEQYNVKIIITPKNKNIYVSQSAGLKKFFTLKKLEFKDRSINLENSDTQIQITNKVTNSTKLFEWNNKDDDFAPVVYLNGRLNKMNDDDTPDFVELSELCLSLFNSEILPEIRPDLNVTKAI